MKKVGVLDHSVEFFQDSVTKKLFILVYLSYSQNNVTTFGARCILTTSTSGHCSRTVDRRILHEIPRIRTAWECRLHWAGRASSSPVWIVWHLSKFDMLLALVSWRLKRWMSPEVKTRKKLPSIEVGPTTLTSPTTISIPCEQWPCPNNMQKFKVNSQSVPKIEWKQAEEEADGGDCITSLAIAVGN